MERKLNKNIEKIIKSLNGINSFPKAIIKHGSRIFLLLFAIGTVMVVVNHAILNYDFYFEFTAKTLIKNSFTVLAEVIIGGLLIDYIFNKP